MSRLALAVALVGGITYAIDDWRISAAVAAAVALVAVRHGALAVASASAAAAAAIHFAVAPEHFAEWWGFGLFFVVCGELQLAWALGLRGRTPRIRRAGAVASLLLVALWAVSRTHGLPFGPEPGVPEEVGMPDLVTVALELVTVVGVLANRRDRSREWRTATQVV